MMDGTLHIKVPAKLESLEQLISFVSDCARLQDMEQKRVVEVEIAVEEALVNIINYAYPGEVGDIELACLTDDKNKVVIEITDSGVPFNLLSLQEPDTSLGIIERGIGGLGIYLIRNLMDDIQYRREDNKNILTLAAIKAYSDRSLQKK